MSDDDLDEMLDPSEPCDTADELAKVLHGVPGNTGVYVRASTGAAYPARFRAFEAHGVLRVFLDFDHNSGTGSQQLPEHQGRLYDGVNEVTQVLAGPQGKRLAALAADASTFKALLKELLEVVDEKDGRGEPCIGGDHTGAVNWLFDFADKVRPLLQE